MDIALVTGAASGLGQAISRRLIDMGFRVYGLGGDYRNCPLKNSDFRPVSCDLADGAAVMREVQGIVAKEAGICLVVNNAKYFPKDPIATVSPQDMDKALRINLLAPLLIARCALPSLQRLQGFIVNLGVTGAESSRGGVIGAATAGGLRWAHEALFNEVRDFGVKVTMISPEPNRRRPAADSGHGGASRGESEIDPDAVASAVAEVVMNKGRNLITEMVIRPQRLIESKLPPVVELPFPEPQPIPYTVPREVIEAEEQIEEERLDREEERDREARRKKSARKRTAGKTSGKTAGKADGDPQPRKDGRAAADKRSGKVKKAAAQDSAAAQEEGGEKSPKAPAEDEKKARKRASRRRKKKPGTSGKPDEPEKAKVPQKSDERTRAAVPPKSATGGKSDKPEAADKAGEAPKAKKRARRSRLRSRSGPTKSGSESASE